MIQPSGFGHQSKLPVKQELTPDQQKTKQACTEFESMIIKKMLESMMSNTQMFGSGFGGSFYQGMFQDVIAESIAKQGIGVSKMLFQQIENKR
jgi:Rod binding domain-containing protein